MSWVYWIATKWPQWHLWLGSTCGSSRPHWATQCLLWWRFWGFGLLGPGDWLRNLCQWVRLHQYHRGSTRRGLAPASPICLDPYQRSHCFPTDGEESYRPWPPCWMTQPNLEICTCNRLTWLLRCLREMISSLTTGIKSLSVMTAWTTPSRVAKRSGLSACGIYIC